MGGMDPKVISSFCTYRSPWAPKAIRLRWSPPSGPRVVQGKGCRFSFTKGE